mgnify:FL=1
MLKDRNIINKEIGANTPSLSVAGHARDEISIESPVILVETNLDITSYNYVYIENFHRYYFIEKRRMIRTNLVEITCQEDYLYTWMSEIYSWTVDLERGQYDWNLYFKDEAFMALEGHNLNVLEFPNSLPQDKHNILIVNGGR